VILTAGARDTARAMAEAALGSGTIERVSDTAGDQTWGAPEPIRCRSGYPRQGGAAAMVARLGNDPGAMVWVPVDAAVREADRITDPSGQRFEVVFVPPLRTDDLLRGVTCVELREPGARL
jgi:hypothetical protein